MFFGIPDKDNAVDLQEFRDCEGMSAKEIFEACGRAEFPDGGCVWINVAPTAQAERYINAYQKKLRSEQNDLYLCFRHNYSVPLSSVLSQHLEQ